MRAVIAVRSTQGLKTSHHPDHGDEQQCELDTGSTHPLMMEICDICPGPRARLIRVRQYLRWPCTDIDIEEAATSQELQRHKAEGPHVGERAVDAEARRRISAAIAPCSQQELGSNVGLGSSVILVSRACTITSALGTHRAYPG
jgi:hypothetical protein